MARFWFADDDIENYPSPQISLPITIGSSDGCALLGDLNSDGAVNILDAVILVNFVLGFQTPTDIEFSASDLNSDGILNVLDIVQLVNIILYGPLEL